MIQLFLDFSKGPFSQPIPIFPNFISSLVSSVLFRNFQTSPRKSFIVFPPLFKKLKSYLLQHVFSTALFLYFPNKPITFVSNFWIFKKNVGLSAGVPFFSSVGSVLLALHFPLSYYRALRLLCTATISYAGPLLHDHFFPAVLILSPSLPILFVP